MKERENLTKENSAAYHHSFIIFVLMCGFLFMGCTGVEFRNIKNDFLFDRVVMEYGSVDHPGPNEVIVISRLVYYQNGKRMVAANRLIELGFVNIQNLKHTTNRVKDTIFYETMTDSHGYFVFRKDRIPCALVYMYQKNGNMDRIYEIPSSPLLMLSDCSSEFVYAGEVRLVKRTRCIDCSDSKYFVDTYFEFYNDLFYNIDYIKNKYSVNFDKLDLIPFLPVDFDIPKC